MTITLTNVVYIDARGNHHLFDDMVVSSRKIRQIQLPKLVRHPFSFINILVVLRQPHNPNFNSTPVQ